MKNLIKIFNLKNPKTLTPTKRKSMEIVILEQPGKFAHMFPYKGGRSPGISLLLFSCWVQSPHPLLHCKTQDFPCSLLPLHAFLLASPSPVAFDPWFTFLRAAAPHDLSQVPASGSVPPLGRYGTLQPATSSTETVPGVVYWPRSSILGSHNYGVSMQGRGKKNLQH